MRLSITRNQTELTDPKGNTEGVIFNLGCRLTFDQDEQDVLEKYRLWAYPLATLTVSEIRGLEQRDAIMSPKRLVDGWSFQTRFAIDAHRVEDTIKDGCSSFKNVMNTLVAYGGDEEVAFN